MFWHKHASVKIHTKTRFSRMCRVATAESIHIKFCTPTQYIKIGPGVWERMNAKFDLSH